MENSGVKSRRGADPSQNPALPGRPRHRPFASSQKLPEAGAFDCGDLEASLQPLSTSEGRADVGVLIDVSERPHEHRAHVVCPCRKDREIRARGVQLNVLH